MGLFTTEDVWNGGFYELALEYDTGKRPGLIEGLDQLWRCKELEGCYLHADRDPDEQTRLAFQPSLLSAGHLFGVVQLPAPTRIPCGTCTVDEDGGSDWLVFYITMSALGSVYGVGGFPFDSGDHESWRVPLEEWLANIGRRIFSRAPFRLGLVGFETSGEIRASELLGGIPKQRRMGLLVPRDDGLEWLPRNEK